MNDPYRDIIDLPHPVSEKHPRMSMRDRAAQFSPFAALTGYDAAIKETARLTGQRIELDEEGQEKISRRLTLLQSHLAESPVAEITYFQPDRKKDGGEYCTVAGAVKKLDTFRRILTLADGTAIPLDEIINVSGEIFRVADYPYA